MRYVYIYIYIYTYIYIYIHTHTYTCTYIVHVFIDCWLIDSFVVGARPFPSPAPAGGRRSIL